jgi:SAM-dependent methyltransferase
MEPQASRASADYVLGYTRAEHERLIRQAVRIAPITERLFREAGIGPGQRVLDLGSGVGDVAMLLARMVSPSGEVVGIERDVNSVARARARVAATELRNVNFIQTEASEFCCDKPFDAAVGRFILMFLPDPIAVLRSVSGLVRPGGILAFQEPSWIPLLALGARLPLWSKVLSSIHETFLRSGVNPEMGPDLCRIFQEIGLPAPTMHMEIALGRDAVLISLISDLLSSVQGLARQHNISLAELGDFDTLPGRIEAEVAASETVVSFVPMVGAWSRKTASPSSG